LGTRVERANGVAVLDRDPERGLTRSLQALGVLLADLARDVDHVEELSADEISGLLCQLGALQSVLAARWVRDLQTRRETGSRDDDRLLTVAEAAERLACSTDWVYRHHHRLPFAVRTGRQLRFSARGLDRYIRQRTGRESASLRAGAER
jgi:excisionase family DNA binding protein